MGRTGGVGCAHRRGKDSFSGGGNHCLPFFTPVAPLLPGGLQSCHSLSAERACHCSSVSPARVYPLCVGVCARMSAAARVRLCPRADAFLDAAIQVVCVCVFVSLLLPISC